MCAEGDSGSVRVNVCVSMDLWCWPCVKGQPWKILLCCVSLCCDADTTTTTSSTVQMSDNLCKPIHESVFQCARSYECESEFQCAP